MIVIKFGEFIVENWCKLVGNKNENEVLVKIDAHEPLTWLFSSSND